MEEGSPILIAFPLSLRQLNAEKKSDTHTHTQKEKYPFC